jgi:hypothetical protein
MAVQILAGHIPAPAAADALAQVRAEHAVLYAGTNGWTNPAWPAREAMSLPGRQSAVWTRTRSSSWRLADEGSPQQVIPPSPPRQKR